MNCKFFALKFADAGLVPAPGWHVYRFKAGISAIKTYVNSTKNGFVIIIWHVGGCVWPWWAACCISMCARVHVALEWPFTSVSLHQISCANPLLMSTVIYACFFCVLQPWWCTLLETLQQGEWKYTARSDVRSLGNWQYWRVCTMYCVRGCTFIIIPVIIWRASALFLCHLSLLSLRSVPVGVLLASV